MSPSGGPFVSRNATRAKNEPIRAIDGGFGNPRQVRRKGSRASFRREGLQKRLIHIKELVDSLPVSEPDYGYKPVRIRPVLDAWAVPEDCGGGGAPLGSSIQPNSQNRSRPGLSGISAQGRKFLKDSLLLMEDIRGSLAFWTVTLPDDDYQYFANGSASWPLFQRRCIDLLCRYLVHHGIEPVAVAAVEIGDHRARRTRRPMPHIHIVTNGWHVHHPDGGWLLCPDRMDQLVAQAAQYAGLPSRERLAVSSVDRIRKSVHNYMSKYLTKQAGIQEVETSDGWEECIPRQWWNASEKARALVNGCLFKLSPAFAAFVVRKQVELERAELGRASAVRVGTRESMTRGTVGIELTKFHFFETEDLLTAIEWYCLWCIDPNVVISGGPPGVP